MRYAGRLLYQREREANVRGFCLIHGDVGTETGEARVVNVRARVNRHLSRRVPLTLVLRVCASVQVRRGEDICRYARPAVCGGMELPRVFLL